MKGQNVIGKIYKSRKMLSRPYGFTLETKYKSNYGGVKSLMLSFKAKGNGSIELFTTNDLLVNVGDFDKSNILNTDEYIAINNDSNEKVQNIIKPDVYNIEKTIGKDFTLKNIEKGLYIPLILEKDNVFKVIDVYLLPTIYQNQEYIEIKLENIKNEKIIIKKEK